MKRRFVTLDVFTTQRHAGNPLAVVLDSGGLDTAAMQAVAREFNLSETVFVASPVNSAHRAALRIFTPGQELPFAGHPPSARQCCWRCSTMPRGSAATSSRWRKRSGLCPAPSR